MAYLFSRTNTPVSRTNIPENDLIRCSGYWTRTVAMCVHFIQPSTILTVILVYIPHEITVKYNCVLQSTSYSFASTISTFCSHGLGTMNATLLPTIYHVSVGACNEFVHSIPSCFIQQAYNNHYLSLQIVIGYPHILYALQSIILHIQFYM